MDSKCITKSVFAIGLLITRTDGRTNERVSHLLKKSFSYVIGGKTREISFTNSGGDCE